MLEVAIVVLMFLGIGVAMRMDVSPRRQVPAKATSPRALTAAPSDNSQARAA